MQKATYMIIRVTETLHVLQPLQELLAPCLAQSSHRPAVRVPWSTSRPHVASSLKRGEPMPGLLGLRRGHAPGSIEAARAREGLERRPSRRRGMPRSGEPALVLVAEAREAHDRRGLAGALPRRSAARRLAPRQLGRAGRLRVPG